MWKNLLKQKEKNHKTNLNKCTIIKEEYTIFSVIAQTQNIKQLIGNK